MNVDVNESSNRYLVVKTLFMKLQIFVLAWLLTPLKVVIPILAVILVWHELHRINFQAVKINLEHANALLLLGASAAALAAVAAMGFYDVFAFRTLDNKQKLSLWKRWLIGCMMFAWSNLIGFGPAIRAIVYGRYGYGLRDISRGISSHYLGSLCGLLAWLTMYLLAVNSLPFFIIGAACASVLFSFLVGKGAVVIEKWTGVSLGLNSQPFAILGLIAFFEWGLSLVSFAFIVQAFFSQPIDVMAVGGAALLGWAGGLLSMIPGGVGTADAIWLNRLADIFDAHVAAAVVVMLRTLFYFVPWVLAILLMYFLVLRTNAKVLRWQRRLVAGIVAVQSLALLVSAATPAIPSSLKTLSQYLPLPIVEGSHALSAGLAFALLFLLRGIVRGYLSAYILVLTILTLSFFANLLKGIDLLESVSCVVTALMLVGLRKGFVRKGRIPVGWLLLLTAGLGGVAFFWVVGFAAFESVPYRPELWTEFAYHADASRFVRVGGLIIFILLLAMVREAVRPVKIWKSADEAEIDKAIESVREMGRDADALLVGAGDKAIWWYGNKGFLLYQVKGSQIFVFKDPVVKTTTAEAEFLAAFLEYCNDEDLEPVFSLVSLAWIEHLHDVGFHFVKISEEAIVKIGNYSLTGSSKSEFRRTLRNVEKQDVSFEVLHPPFSETVKRSVLKVSDCWIHAKGGHELQFTAGYFSAAYIERNPLALAKTSEGEIIAFVNLLCVESGGSATIDFMRYIPDKVPSIMDYVLIKSLIYLGERGYKTFSLGSAPLVAVGDKKGAIFIEKIMHRASLYAESIYNYRGLRMYKNKFKPEWKPRYLAYRYPWNVFQAIANNARLVQARSKSDIQRIAEARIV